VLHRIPPNDDPKEPIFGRDSVPSPKAQNDEMNRYRSAAPTRHSNQGAHCGQSDSGADEAERKEPKAAKSGRTFTQWF